MKFLGIKQEICNGCGSCEAACSKLYFKEENKKKSAIRIVNNFNTFQATKCTQCGECINMCTAAAIYRDKLGVVRIKKDRCVGCLGCVGFCTYLAMFYYENENIPFKCVACGVCAKSCPQEALVVCSAEQKGG
jgi:Fe-S-cluster-containing hydrogenase component 2